MLLFVLHGLARNLSLKRGRGESTQASRDQETILDGQAATQVPPHPSRFRAEGNGTLYQGARSLNLCDTALQSQWRAHMEARCRLQGERRI